MSKRQLMSAAILFILSLSLASCKAESPASETPQEISETSQEILETPQDFVSQAPLPVGSPEPPVVSNPAEALNPPLIPAEERKVIWSPYLVKLEPYDGGSYTDGYNTFIFRDDGTVIVKHPTGIYSGQFIYFEKKDIYRSPVSPDTYTSDEFSATLEKAEEKASELYGFDYSFDLDWLTYNKSIVYKDGSAYYLNVYYPRGDYADEPYYHTTGPFLFKISADGSIMDYGQINAVYIVWHDGYFYYVELAGDLVETPGIGKVIRMDMDGSNKKTIINEPVYGPFQIVNNRLYYSALADGKAYSTDLEGADKTPVGSRIAPDHHRVWLEFYGDMIISKFWQYSGFSIGRIVAPHDYYNPAVMDIYGNDLLTFPAELCGPEAYEVVNWGANGSEETGNSYDSYLFLKSNYDGSYWKYSKWASYGDDLPSQMYEWAREEWAAKSS